MLSTPYQAIARTIVAVTAACGLFIPISGASETAARDAAFRDETVLAVAGMVEDGYVYPEMGHRLAEHLRQSLRTGGYDEMETGGQLAGKLTGLYWRSIDGINQSWTLPHVQGKRLLHTDLYILTSRSTFSAAEAFA